MPSLVEFLPVNLRLLFICLLSPLAAPGENWPGFRGPGGQGHSAESDLPLEWSMDEGLAWTADIPGRGWSSPVVWEGRVVVTTATDRDRSCRVICLDLESGAVLWNTEVFRQVPPHKERRNSHATPTPAAGPLGVFAVFGNGSIAGLDWSGALLWINDEVEFYSRHGLGASPLLADHLLVMPYDGSNRVPEAGRWPDNSREERLGWQIPWERAFLLAVDVRSGRTAWRAGRGFSRIAHVTPCLITAPDGSRQILSPAGDVIQGFDPESGRRIWSVRSRGEGVTPGPAWGDGLIFTASGFERTTLRTVRMGGRGEVTATHIAWEGRKGVPSESSLLYVGPHLHAVTSGGILTCFEGRSGEIVYQERIGGRHCASPVLADGRILFQSMEGEVIAVAPGPEYRVLARNRLEGEFQASPAVSRGRILLRSADRLYCVGERGK